MILFVLGLIAGLILGFLIGSITAIFYFSSKFENIKLEE